ncbi:hypothetical protein GOP47_0025840 [Adiantum capillus-veneris]|uniref:AAA+ ATPase domain-containing protein n=1 Tax=Adiantum capillus-veneris TaxID=13818 RepID=A0A9D4U3K2_ADICA|nr:hypothetical protein GOP47_0025840 [Adiantum capillus-veneris]
MGVFALLQTFLPPAFRQYLNHGLALLWDKFVQTENRHVEYQVEEKTGGSYNHNIFYRQVGIYLSSLRSSMDSHTRLKVCRSVENGSLAFSLLDNEALEDSFNGACLWWTHTCMEREGGNNGNGNGNGSGDERSFTLRFLTAERSIVMPAYLDHVSKVAAEIEHRNTQRWIYTNNHSGYWEATIFNHPSTFNTLALDDGLADHIQADLEFFRNAESFYHRNGRAWKRGYLLYGPPGTGKSSMIAAIANHVEYDIYDLELTKVCDNAELKSLMIQTIRRSVIVIEDIDCSVHLSDRAEPDKYSQSTSGYTADSNIESAIGPSSEGTSKLTLSGLLNVTDGLWSCCGEERIFIFTTNHKDRLDPALLRQGRMDMHILLSYCTFPAFKKLANNYLGIEDHPMYVELEDAMARTAHKITPAAMAEMLISNQSDPDAALRQVMASLPRYYALAQDVVASTSPSEKYALEDSPLKKGSTKKDRLRGRILFFLAAIEGKRMY